MKNNITTKTELEFELNKLAEDIITRSRDGSTVLKRVKSYNNERPDDFMDMINNKNKIGKTWQQQRRGEDRIKILNKTINKAIQEHRNQL